MPTVSKQIEIPFLGFAIIAIVCWFVCSASVAIAAGKEVAVLLVEKQQKGCAFRFHFPALNKTDDWFELPDCLSATENFVFDRGQGRALILHAGKVWAVDLKRNAKPAVLTDAFKLRPEQKDIETKTWIDKANGRLRVARLIEETPAARALLVQDPANRSASGKWPGEGVRSVALVAELDADKRWKLLAVRRTTAEADLAFGLDVVSSFISPNAGIVSLHDLLMQATCAQQACASKPALLSKDARLWARQVFRADRYQDGPPFGYIPLGENDGFISGIAFGDSFHWNTPIFYCTGGPKNRCATRKVLAFQKSPLASDGQKGISTKSGYVLFTQEYEGVAAQLYKSGSGNPITTYKADTIAAWMPFAPW